LAAKLIATFELTLCWSDVSSKEKTEDLETYFLPQRAWVQTRNRRGQTKYLWQNFKMENSQEYREQGRQGKQRNSEWVGHLTKM